MGITTARCSLALTALMVLTSTSIAQAGTATGRERAALERFRGAVNAHQTSVITRLFAQSAVLSVPGHTYRGRAAVVAWWKSQFAHHLRLTFQGTPQVQGRRVRTVLAQQDNRACARGCHSQLTVQFSGALLARMTISALQAPPVAHPTPGHPSLPPVPVSPPPAITPTIPT